MPDQTLTTEFEGWLLSTRNHLHMHPELSGQEAKTMLFLERALTTMEVSFDSGIGGFGIVATIEASNPGAHIAYRCDMDALPIQEANDNAYASRHLGLMHACGHDVHMTICLGIIRSIKSSDWIRNGQGVISFIFQPAEETGEGAQRMLSEAKFRDQQFDFVLAIHVDPFLPLGRIEVSPQIATAKVGQFDLKLTGSGGHPAFPEQASQIMAMQARSISILQETAVPGFIAVPTKVTSDNPVNVIPNQIMIQGLFRAFKEGVYEESIDDIRALLEVEGEKNGVDVSLMIKDKFEMTRNTPLIIKLLSEYARKNPEIDWAKGAPKMVGEDFSYISHQWTSAFLWFGAATPEMNSYPLHSNKFDVSPKVMTHGVRTLSKFMLWISKNINEYSV